MTDALWEYVECPDCKGRPVVSSRPATSSQFDGPRPMASLPVCQTCNGDGRVRQLAGDPREKRLSEPHIWPLMDLVRDLQSHGLKVPNVDPDDGGTQATVLFLSETPGPKAVNSDYVSRDNPDPSARNMGKALDAAGFSRTDVVLWNVVPYCVSTATENRNASGAQIREAAIHTQAFINRLPKLRAVVFCGRQAQRAAQYLKLPPEVRAPRTFHSGAQSYNHSRCRDHILATFKEARELTSSPM